MAKESAAGKEPANNQPQALTPETLQAQVQAILETLVPGLNMLYLVTEREEQFEEQAEELFDSQGLIVAMTKPGTENPSGNLILDLHDWEMHLDIIS